MSFSPGRMKRTAVCSLWLVLLSLIIPTPSLGQVDSTAKSFHIFPQIAEGRMFDGSSWQSWLIATNTSVGSNSCAYQLHGMNADRIADIAGLTKSVTTATFTLPAIAAFILLPTLGQADLASGYATLDCMGSVTAQALYVLSDSFDRTVSMATVFSSQTGTLAQFPVLEGSGVRLAVAIANDGLLPARCDMVLADPVGDSVGIKTLTIPSRTNFPSFVDENVTIPTDPFLGSVGLWCDSQVSLIGLLFSGSRFTTVPATIFAP